MRSVFVSYRRGDSEGQARALNFELVKLIGRDSVFMDVDSIALGQDFRRILHERLESCDLLLALIGPGWLDAKDAAGNRRLESDTDLVRQEIAAALTRSIPVIPVLLQGAQMPPAERLPVDLKDLVYRNGFELGHSTWESDVNEMFRRLGLDTKSADPAREAGDVANTAKSALAGLLRTPWLRVTLVVSAIVAAVFLYQKGRSPGSGGEIVGALQHAASVPEAVSIPQRPASTLQTADGVSPSQLTGTTQQRPAGLGVITIANLKTRTVEVYEQSSSGGNFTVPGFAGRISPTATTLQVPVGTYKLKFDGLFLERVVVTSAGSREIVLGTISLPGLSRVAEVYEQSSSGGNFTVPGFTGRISPTATALQVPAGTYRLKFDQLFLERVAVTSARSTEIVLGTISLPHLSRVAEVYEQSSSGGNFTVPGFAGRISPPATALQVPAGTYKLKFDQLFVQPVRVESGKTVVAQ